MHNQLSGIHSNNIHTHKSTRAAPALSHKPARKALQTLDIPQSKALHTCKSPFLPGCKHHNLPIRSAPTPISHAPRMLFGFAGSVKSVSMTAVRVCMNGKPEDQIFWQPRLPLLTSCDDTAAVVIALRPETSAVGTGSWRSQANALGDPAKSVIWATSSAV